jgi:dTDP-4-amino-4,6-dideoxygalactose transaminase
MAANLTTKLQGLAGIETPSSNARDVHTYWKYCLRIDGKMVRGGAVELAKCLAKRGIASAPRYIQKPAFMCEVFQRPEAVDYSRSKFTGTFDALEGILVLPWNERYTEEHVNYIAGSIRESLNQLALEAQ